MGPAVPRLGADAGERYGPDDGRAGLRRVGRDGERLSVRRTGGKTWNMPRTFMICYDSLSILFYPLSLPTVAWDGQSM